MASLPKCGALRDAVSGWDWVAIMVLYCQISIAEDHDFARRMNQLLQEMVVAYDDKVDFIQELEAVPGVDATGKTDEFLKENLSVPGKMAEFMKQVQGKDILNLMKLQILQREFNPRAQEKELFIEKLKGNMDY
ncbi:hypothetical protein Tco_1384636 [Tanacetum coccineum]